MTSKGDSSAALCLSGVTLGLHESVQDRAGPLELPSFDRWSPFSLITLAASDAYIAEAICRGRSYRDNCYQNVGSSSTT